MALIITDDERLAFFIDQLDALKNAEGQGLMKSLRDAQVAIIAEKIGLTLDRKASEEQ